MMGDCFVAERRARRVRWTIVLVVFALAMVAGLAGIAFHLRQPFTLVQSACSGWEAQDLNYYFKATTRIGRVTEYKLDVNNDGVFDHTSSHIAKISGALEFNLPLLQLLGNPADDGKYPATVRIYNNWGMYADFPVEIVIGNMPPDITFGENTEGWPGEPYLLSVFAPDPGPDTVKQIIIDWGDGTTSVITGESGTAIHVYPTNGIYTIRATATDEDDSYWAESVISIGDNDAPVVPSDDPQIVSSVSAILPNGNASLTITAVDAEGSSNLSYQWDTDDDGVCETSGGPTVEIAPGTSFYRYMSSVRITDSKGRWTEAFYAFDKNPQAPPENATHRVESRTP